MSRHQILLVPGGFWLCRAAGWLGAVFEEITRGACARVGVCAPARHAQSDGLTWFLTGRGGTASCVRASEPPSAPAPGAVSASRLRAPSLTARSAVAGSCSGLQLGRRSGPAYEIAPEPQVGVSSLPCLLTLYGDLPARAKNLRLAHAISGPKRRLVCRPKRRQPRRRFPHTPARWRGEGRGI